MTIFDGLWLSVILANAALFGLLLWRKAWQHHGAFLGYTGFCTSANILEFIFAHYSPGAYYKAFLPISTAGTLLQLLVAASLIRAAFRPPSAIRPRVVLFCLALAGAVAACVAFCVGESNHSLLVFDRSATLLLAAVFASIVLFSFKLGIYWRSREHGICLGFLISIGCDSIRSVLTSVLGDRWAIFSFNYFLMASYLLTIFVWGAYFIAPDTPQPAADPSAGSELQAWSENVHNEVE